MIYAILLAAGTGSRFNSQIPKQFYKINDRAAMEYPLEKFINNPKIDQVVVVINSNYEKEYIDIFNKFSSAKISYTSGSTCREKSVLNGLNSIESYNKDDFVIIHDAARIYVTEDLINKHIDQKSYDAVNTTLDSKDSLLYVEDTQIKPLNRDKVRIVQTPQSFNLMKIKDLLQKECGNLEKYTDTFSIAIENNFNWTLVNGEETNIKITTPNDVKGE